MSAKTWDMTGGELLTGLPSSVPNGESDICDQRQLLAVNR